MMQTWKKATAAAVVLGVASLALTSAHASDMFFGHQGYNQKNLVSNDTSKIPADHQDTELVNPWGDVFFPAGPFWLNENGSGQSALFLGDGSGVGGGSTALAVTVPTPSGTGQSAPTGIVLNGTQAFQLKNKTTSIFIFDTEDGTISAWNLGTGFPGPAELEVDNSAETCTNGATGAVYKALAYGATTAGPFLYATNFRCGTVDVFDGTWAPAMAGKFRDPLIPPGYAPFGIVNISGNLFVTYAKQNAAKHDDEAGVGRGFVDVFDTSGNLIKRFAVRGALNSPWGVALAPYNFGQVSNDILIGNFGDGRINAFDAHTGVFEGSLRDPSHRPISIDGLWSIVFGGGALSDPAQLYFTAGPNGETDGLFGRLTPQ
ncbi:MAG TPA: TIGR03118 family protein [Candidatus Binataceae bacterium]|nr:TIGR03118 family protein [Candidatus Binataceae bacterium]